MAPPPSLGAGGIKILPKVAKQQPLANYLFLIICNFLQSYKFFLKLQKIFSGYSLHYFFVTHFGKLCTTHAPPTPCATHFGKLSEFVKVYCYNSTMTPPPPLGQKDVYSHCRGDWQIALTKQNFSIITFRIFTIPFRK